MRATIPAAALRRVAVHVFQPAVCECEDGRHVQSSADDLDIGTGFAVAGGLHRGLEFAERRDPGGEPIGASESARQFGISPGRQVVVRPIWIFFQGSLDEIALVIENKDDDIGGEPAMLPISFAVNWWEPSPVTRIVRRLGSASATPKAAAVAQPIEPTRPGLRPAPHPRASWASSQGWNCQFQE